MSLTLQMHTGLVAVGALACAASASADQTFSLVTGGGTPGTVDPNVTMLVGPIDGPFDDPFTPTDFANADAGPNAFNINPNAFWFPGVTAADWIGPTASANGDNNAGSALYAYNFTLTDAVIISATLDMTIAADNGIGETGRVDAQNANAPLPDIQGVYLNGTAVSGSSVGTGGTFSSSPFTLSRTDIAPLLNPGLNTLYVYQVDTGGPAGLSFTANFDIVGVPEPGSLALLALGGLMIARRRRA